LSSTASQLELFQTHLPKKPYCTNQLGYISIRPREQAVSFKYLQHNQPSLVSFLVFDVDRENATFAWKDANLPEPMWVATNPANGHAHICYALKTPVCRSDAARRKPLNYLAVIEAALCERLDADVGYAGLLCKNPLHPHWMTMWLNTEPYELHYLSEFCPDLHKYKRRKKWTKSGIGRNVSLFENVRIWAYSAVREYWYPGGEKHWRKAVISHCEAVNRSAFPTPLDIHESDAVAKSIAKWVWQTFTPGDFKAIQSHRGRKGGKAKLGKRSAGSGRRTSPEVMKQILELHSNGYTNRDIADDLKISAGTVSNYLKRARE
jgi:hypothetical protein